MPARQSGPSRPAILFVCLGNICRSPLAEGAFRARATAAGLDVMADSAGTGDWHVGHPPDPRAQAVARANGVDISGLRARQVRLDDFTRFSHIFAADHANLGNLRRLAPDPSPAELALLLDLVKGRQGQAVADPYYGDAQDFARSWAEVDAAAQALVARLLNH
ncbi:low molecular weight phosphotyrosine protein phosphatase [Sandaracinobacter neustonicus]|uniref:protein-tyrosine-phosphatase n=1 Tax=Sandaracinobacter neustonicus TaxID=1715348 RepID=A0A501XLJ3_9SPHN|nr:low molecular weight protein-tyrosine-phosphatase [Sandaracinobacter neustonicus]TPE61144.1 low molecular weight phosphotyrosine protein phosphatase [Sandaracinobacter neustonicus]